MSLKRRWRRRAKLPRIGFGKLRFKPLQVAVALLVLAAAALVSQLLGPVEGQVTRVIDGDTIDVYLGGGDQRVRLLGVDTPEVHHPERGEEPFGREASEFTRKALLGRRVRLLTDPLADNRDRYGRLLRLVELQDGTDFNSELVRYGYAKALRRFPFSRKEYYLSLEQEARRSGLGMWAGRR